MLNVAVVGHTNTGKTSLIRTMLRSTEFGVIEDASGTTRHVEQATISADDQPVLNLYDTPGLEDSGALFLHIKKLNAKSKSLTPVKVLENFVENVSVNDPLEQEAKVIRQVLRSDVLLYIIDVREPFLEKYRIELDILTKSAKPIIPIFNFIAEHNEDLAKWREQLAAYNIHASLEFDTVAFTFEAEKRLYQKMQTLVEPHYANLQKLIDHRAKIWNQLCLSGAKRVAELIVNVACYRESKGTKSSDVADTLSVDRLQDFVRKAEQRCLKDLLSIFNFSEKDVEIQKIPVSNGQWQLDIFAPGILKSYGLDVGSAAAKGAAAGAGIDLMVGGMSLGAASALGAIAGAGWSTFRRYGDEIKAKVQGTHWQCADENTLGVLYLRQKQLLEKLMHRGHAALDAMQVETPKTEKLPDNWTKLTSTLRQNPSWRESSASRNNNKNYQEIEAKLVSALLEER
jgi:small GTP-binding protein